MKKTKSLLIFIPSIENGGVEKKFYILLQITLTKKNLRIKVLTALK